MVPSLFGRLLLGTGIGLSLGIGAIDRAAALPPPAPSAPAEAARPAGPSPDQPQAPVYEHAAVRQLVTFVEAAAAQIEQRGEQAFPELRRRGGRWFQGDRYAFVTDPQARLLVYPPDPGSEGASILGDQDFGGKPIGRMLVERAGEADGRGWVHYQWRRPNRHDRRPVWKSTYVVRVKLPSGASVLVGSGLYEPPMEKAFVMDEVEAAAVLLQQQGRAAFPQLRDRRGRFFYNDTYVFVDTPQGVELVNPAFAEVEGRNILQLRDAEGRPMVRDYLQLARERGSGWTRYLWPQPDHSSLPVRKHTYVRQVVLPDGEILVVGSGLYDP
jgi:signal transduction histidine kinase